MSTSEVVRTDGRRARRERNRIAVIDALYELLAEGVHPVQPDAVAARAGVSVSSLFRYFDGLDDLLEQTVGHHMERVGHLFEVPALGQGPLDERIGGFVSARLELYEAIAPVARVARAQAMEHRPIADQLHEVRARLRDQIRVQFASELPASRPDADDLVDLVDALTSFESWDLLRTGPGRSAERIGRAWSHAIAVLLVGGTVDPAS